MYFIKLHRYAISFFPPETYLCHITIDHYHAIYILKKWYTIIIKINNARVTKISATNTCTAACLIIRVQEVGVSQ